MDAETDNKKINFAADRLRSIVERIERLSEERAAISADITEIYTEAKGTGFDTKALRHLIRLRKQSEQDRQELDYMVDTYMRALGME